jgi:hypothetical protein
MIYNTKITDLSEKRQENFYETLNRLGFSEKWGATALTINDKDNWEHYGFGCFSQRWLQDRVAAMLKGNNITVDTVYAELQELKEDYAQLVEFVNKLAKQVERN